MKRHAALIALSHDHHHGLVEARRLRRAAAAEPAERRDAAAAFLAFFADETRGHFRDEEEQLFPLLAGAAEPATELLTQALLQHQQIRALVRELETSASAGDVPPDQMLDVATTLEQHIRFEERSLFPMIEDVVPEDALQRLAEAPAQAAPNRLLSVEGTGPLWGAETEDLNATLLAWPPGGGPSEHVNAERDVLLVVLAGSATVTVDGEGRRIDAGQAVTIAKGRMRRIAAGAEGVRYLSVHTRRPPLQIARARA